jgi:topoisomerase IA-like protein
VLGVIGALLLKEVPLRSGYLPADEGVGLNEGIEVAEAVGMVPDQESPERLVTKAVPVKKAAPAKKTAAKKASAKKATAKQAPAKKTVAKKAPASAR